MGRELKFRFLPRFKTLILYDRVRDRSSSIILRDLLKIPFFFSLFFFPPSLVSFSNLFDEIRKFFDGGILNHIKEDIRYKGKEEEGEERASERVRERETRFTGEKKRDAKFISFNIVKFYSFHRISFKNKIIRKKIFLRFLDR